MSAGEGSRRLNHWAIALGALAVTCATLLHALQLRSTLLREDAEELRVSAAVMSRSVNRTLLLVQELLKETDTDIRLMALGGPQALDALEAVLRHQRAEEPLVGELLILGPDGRVLASSRPEARGHDLGARLSAPRMGDGSSLMRLAGLFPGVSATQNSEVGHSRHLLLWVPLSGRSGLIAAASIDSDSMRKELADLITRHTDGFSLFIPNGEEWVCSAAEGAASVPGHPPLPRPPDGWGQAARFERDARDADWLTHVTNLRDFPLLIQTRASIQGLNNRWWQAMLGPLLLLGLMLAGLLFYHRRALRLMGREEDARGRLVASEQQLASIVEHAAEGIVSVGQDGIVRRLNRAAAATFGVEPAWAIGRRIDELFWPGERKPIQELMLTYRDQFDSLPQVTRGALPTRRIDGHELNLDYSLSRHIEQDNRMVTAIFRDLSDMREAERRFSTLFQQSSEAQLIASLPPESSILDCNQAAVALLGAMRREDLIGRRRETFLAPDTVEDRIAPERLGPQYEALADGQTVRVKGRIRTLTQRLIPVELSATQLRLGPRTVRLITIRDLSAAEETEQALRASQQAAEAASQAKSRFLAVMSHELRTPMSGIIGMIDLLGESDLDAEQRRFLGVLRHSSAGLLQVLNDVLDYSKLEAGRVELEQIDFDLDALMSSILSVHRASALQRNTLLKVDWGGEPTRSLRGDPTRLAQVLHNLIGNAIKFSPSGSVTVRLDTERIEGAGHRLHVQVIDTGVGMSEDVQQSLFRPFSQADASMTRRFGGTGLGLAICKHLVEAMGGSISVASSPGRGSIFAFDVRMDEATGTPGTRNDSAEPTSVPRARRSLQLLAAEDNPTNRLLLELRLRRMGHRLHVVENGEQAVEAARLARYDAILMDIHMPVMDGATATRAIRALAGDAGNLPIIGLSADALPEMRDQHMQSGLTAYLTKPLDWAVLGELLESVVPADRGIPLGDFSHTLASDALEDHHAVAPRVDAVAVAAVRREFGADSWSLIAQVFWERAAADLARCAAAVAVHDRAALQVAAHSLKGAANTLGFRAIGDAAAVLERCGDGESSQALQRLQERFEATAIDWRTNTKALA